MRECWTRVKTQDLRVGYRVRLGKREGAITSIEPGRMKTVRIAIDDNGKPLVGLCGADWDVVRDSIPESGQKPVAPGAPAPAAPAQAVSRPRTTQDDLNRSLNRSLRLQNLLLGLELAPLLIGVVLVLLVVVIVALTIIV